MEKLQSDKNMTRQVRIDAGYHKELKILAANLGKSVRELLEEGCVYVLDLYVNKKS